MKNKITILIASVILLATCLTTSFQINPLANAEDGIFWSFNFDNATELSKHFSVEKFNATSSVSIVDGALRIDNVDTDTSSMTDRPTEVTLPTVYSDDYVLEFDMTRRAGDGSVAIRYAMQESGKGYEFRIHLLQDDPGSGWHYAFSSWSNEKACEYRRIYTSDVTTDTCEWRFWDFNFYESDFEIDQTYHITFLRHNGWNDLFVNDLLILHYEDDNQLYDIFDTKAQYREQDDKGRLTFGDLKLRVNSTATVDFDNMKVQTVSKNLADQVDAFGDTSTWDDAKLIENERIIKQVYGLFQTKLTASEREANDKYDDMLNLYNRYRKAIAPTLTVNWTVDDIVAQKTEIDLLALASATDRFGTALSVDVEVKFGDKYLLVKNGKVKLNEKGDYTVVYTVYDANGNSVSKEYVVTVA